MTIADLKDDIVGVQAATTDYDAAAAMQKSGTIRGVKVCPFARIADAVADLRHGTIGARGVRDSSSVSIKYRVVRLVPRGQIGKPRG